MPFSYFVTLLVILTGPSYFCAGKIGPADVRNYHECLIRRERRLNSGALSAHAIVAIENETVALYCFDCPYPVKLSKEKTGFDVIWRRISIAGAESEIPNESNGPFELDSRTGILLIKNIKPANVAFYTCGSRKSESTEPKRLKNLYFVDVVKARPLKLILPGDDNECGSGNGIPILEDLSQKLGIRLVRDWQEWTDCDRCNWPGERKQDGPCRIQVTDLNLLRKQENAFLNLLEVFSEGLPCYSSLVPAEDVGGVNLRKMAKSHEDKIRFRSCKEDCEPVDKKPKMIKRLLLNGSEIEIPLEADTYLLSDELPAIPKTVVRLAEKRLVGEQVTLECPPDEIGAKYWMKDGEPIYSAKLYYQSTGRIILDANFEIHIWNMTEEDSGQYSCWRFDDFLLLTNSLKVEMISTIKRISPLILTIVTFLGTGGILLLIGLKTLGVRRMERKNKEVELKNKEEKMKMEERKPDSPKKEN